MSPESTPSVDSEAYLDMDLLRFTTAGSVDDGKSTLIGRLLYDSKAIFEDQLEAVESASAARGKDVDLALLTDGLRAEREQGITIDVAYRYFATPRRKFIIADTPGHVQYTRNMVTGASTADLAVILIDAKKGVSTQSRRHGFIASLLGIPHLVVAVNKMDLVDYDERVFDEIVRDYTAFTARLATKDVTFIPVSALKGDNVVERSPNMAWYDGSTLLHHLEHVNVASDRNLIDFRFPVQMVIRPGQSFRGYAGTVASGVIHRGDEVVALPSGMRSTVQAVTTFEGEQDEARAADAVVLSLEDEIDISRGDMIVRANNRAKVGTRIDAMLCWMSETPLETGRRYFLRHTTREVQAFVDEVVYQIDVDTLHRDGGETLALNDIGRVQITTASPIFYDTYRSNHETGAFILVDPESNNTVAAGMIRGGAEMSGRKQARQVSPDVVWEGLNIPREDREARQEHKAAVLWFTGLSGAGKTTIAREVEKRLFEKGTNVVMLDGDHVRHGLSGDLGFSASDREENIRRIGEVARLFFETGAVTLCTFVSPYAADRQRVRELFPDGSFFEIHVDVDIDTARERDPKGLYAKADSGEIESFTGVSSPYEAPESPEIRIDTTGLSVEEAVEVVLKELAEREIVKE